MMTFPIYGKMFQTTNQLKVKSIAIGVFWFIHYSNRFRCVSLGLGRLAGLPVKSQHTQRCVPSYYVMVYPESMIISTSPTFSLRCEWCSDSLQHMVLFVIKICQSQQPHGWETLILTFPQYPKHIVIANTHAWQNMDRYGDPLGTESLKTKPASIRSK